ncbi:MAG: hypothetical protein AAF193_10455, partial [Bacteroidota bacterium]
MSAGILKALMQLFAIIARGNESESTSDDGRAIVAMFLRQQLNKELVQKYLELYEEFRSKNSGKKRDTNRKKKRTSLNSVKVLRICTKINE